MIEVDGIRRAYGAGSHFDPYSQVIPRQLPAHIGTQPLDPHPGLIHWNRSPNTGSTGTRTDDEDEEDEDRPFTPPPPRERLSYTRYQLELLNAIYLEVRYPNSTQKQLIAKRVGITREQVKIWFQNRRRKDVVGNSGKNKACDTSTSSTGSTGSKDPEVESPSQTESESNSSSDDGSPAKETEESVVPDVVMKSVISELLKFVNDPLKGKKNKKKKSRTKKKDNVAVKKGLSATLLAGSYDMVSPPNQVTPSAFFEKMKSGFNHSNSSSAFESPREGIKPPQIGQISSSTEVSSDGKSKSQDNSFHSNVRIDSGRPLQDRRGNFLHGSLNAALPAHSGSHSLEIPIMSDILTYKSGLEARHKDIMAPAVSSHMTSSVPNLTQPHRTVSERNNPFSHFNNLTPGRPINGIYPFPFLAEQPMLLSSLRQQDHVFRPSPHYPFSHLGGEDPYQPLLISSLNNPYYSQQTTSWSSPTIQNPSMYTQI